jgi:coenzyme PQQ precursor peptide PqqA
MRPIASQGGRLRPTAAVCRNAAAVPRRRGTPAANAAPPTGGAPGRPDRGFDGRLTRRRHASSLRRVHDLFGSAAMSWKKPVIIEIAVGCEINAYACAE